MKPILFNTEMVRAILDGRKTVTRRVVKFSIPFCDNNKDGKHNFIKDSNLPGGSGFTGFVCRNCGFGIEGPRGKYPCGTSWLRPPYRPGDILYVRETWKRNPYDYEKFLYRADGCYGPDMPWLPSIHMPKDAARIFLRVTDVRVERLRDITTVEKIHEGMDTQEAIHSPWKWIGIWEGTIKPYDICLYGWDANPWVWVIEFERITKEETDNG